MAGTALLFAGYLRLSWTVAATSDGAAQALQARDMLAGNWLLHGWTLSDVSFYPTELPEYVLVELTRPFGLGVIHVAAALTYTLLTAAAVVLARGRASGREGAARALIAGTIMLAPQLGYGAFVLLLSPDHVGTEVPLLLGWLLLDLAPRRWWVPAMMCALLTVVQFADRVVVLTAVLPLIVVCAVTVARRAKYAFGPTRAGPNAHSAQGRRPRDGEGGGAGEGAAVGEGAGDGAAVGEGAGEGAAVGRWARAGWFEPALIAAGVGSVGLASAAARALAAAGGFTAHPFSLTLAPASQLWTHTWLTGWGVLELYGANFLGVTGSAGLAFAALHLIGLAVAIIAVAVTLGRFVRPSAHRGISAAARNAKGASAQRPAAPTGLERYGPQRQTRGREARPRAKARAAAGGLRSDGAKRLSDEGAGSGPERAAASGKTQRLSDEGAGSGLKRAVGRGPETSGLVSTVLAVAVVANLVSYLLSTAPGTVLGTGYDAREIAAVLPLGAVLAGRLFGPWLAGVAFGSHAGRPRRRYRLSLGAGTTVRSNTSVFMAFVFFIAIAGYASAFGYSAAQPGAPGQESALAGWLVAHGLRYGLGESSANVVTVDSGDRVRLLPVAARGGRVRALLYQSASAAYDPRLHQAYFLVSRVPGAVPGEPGQALPDSAVRATFGPPARTYRFDGYTVLAWGVNLLTRIGE